MSSEKQKTTFDSFFRKEYKKLVNYVRKNIEENFLNVTPEDIVQDVALNLLNKIDVDLQIENFAAYTYRSLKNRIIDEERKVKNNFPIESFEKNPKLNSEVISISDDTETETNEFSDVDIEEVHRAISKLNPLDQEIILLTEMEGKTFNELSDEWEVPVGTLLSRKHRALAKLYKLLTEKENKFLKINNNGNERKLSRKKLLPV